MMDKKRIVVKVGTSSLTYDNGRLKLGQIEKLVREVADLVNSGIEVAIVSSGAVGAGLGPMGLTHRPKRIEEKQAAAAVGQGILMQTYSRLFAEYSHVCGQVLITAEDLEQRNRYLNSRNTLEVLLQNGIIPIINENDSVSFDEIAVGDNDTLSALVATLISADLLIILSDIDGVYTEDPRHNSKAQLIPIIEEITPEIEAMAGGKGTLGTGGMATKFQAAQIATNAGIPVVITNGAKDFAITQTVNGESIGTKFLAKPVKLPSRKRWLASISHPRGQIIIDRGAEEALYNGKSLLPIGVVSYSGEFQSGDLVQIINSETVEIAKGLCNYSNNELDRIMGKCSEEIERLEGTFSFQEVVHRNNLVITKVVSRKGRAEWK
ncbi:MAG: glutamate 5-kinase [Firmicutes bacterium]|nr:glutamate 5-kinase [Bacillota bacterium]